ncbi:hypothetical protein NDU88_006112 [Pleurodeles waltl]|uniref:Uncharacterized protein n=1 Tax=Pleurodeles waltl TaxID=8319 RepID=A0AAV7VLY4_PLEWA|nr:hypothetical protein NDU88_006112 [Pleurodeles waltl]
MHNGTVCESLIARAKEFYPSMSTQAVLMHKLEIISLNLLRIFQIYGYNSPFELSTDEITIPYIPLFPLEILLTSERYRLSSAAPKVPRIGKLCIKAVRCSVNISSSKGVWLQSITRTPSSVLAKPRVRQTRNNDY